MFTFKGITSDSLGVIAEEEDFLARAARRADKLEINGVDGAEYTELGYSDIEQSVNLQLTDTTKLDAILAWLDGVGEFIFNGRKTTARFYNSLQPSRMVYLKSIPATFIRAPFWYLTSEINQTITASGTTIVNSGNAESWPLLKITGSGAITVTLNEVTFGYTFDTPYVYVDCIKGKTRQASYLSARKNRQKTGGWPSLAIGNNTIAWTGSITSIIVTKRTCFL